MLRRAGYHPATLLGIAVMRHLAPRRVLEGRVGLSGRVFLTVVFTLSGTSSARAATTRPCSASRHAARRRLRGRARLVRGADPQLPSGIGVLSARCSTTVAYDVGGFFVGRSLGTRRCRLRARTRPSKAWSAAWILAVLVAVVVVGFISPWDSSSVSLADKVLFGLVAALAAPLGDLCRVDDQARSRHQGHGHAAAGPRRPARPLRRAAFVLPAAYYAARSSSARPPGLSGRGAVVGAWRQ